MTIGLLSVPICLSSRREHAPRRPAERCTRINFLEWQYAFQMASAAVSFPNDDFSFIFQVCISFAICYITKHSCSDFSMPNDSPGNRDVSKSSFKSFDLLKMITRSYGEQFSNLRFSLWFYHSPATIDITARRLGTIDCSVPETKAKARAQSRP